MCTKACIPQSVIKALESAVGEQKIDQMLIQHSGRGAQYCSGF